MKPLKYLFLLLLVSSCNAPQAVYDYDEDVQFTEIKSYQIFPDLASNLNQLDEQRVLAILEEELSEKGLTTESNPEIYINFYSQEYEAASRNSLGVGVGGGGGNVGVGVSGGIPIGGPERYLQLTVDFIDVEKDALIWQAVVEGKFHRDTTPEKREARLRRMIEKALKGFPPKG